MKLCSYYNTIASWLLLAESKINRGINDSEVPEIIALKKCVIKQNKLKFSVPA